MLGEGVEHAELGVVEAAPDAIATSAPARAPLMWTEAASAPSALGRARGLRRGGGDDRELGLRALAAGRGGGHDRALGVERVVEHERDGAAAEQAAGARR